VNIQAAADREAAREASDSCEVVPPRR